MVTYSLPFGAKNVPLGACALATYNTNNNK